MVDVQSRDVFATMANGRQSEEELADLFSEFESHIINNYCLFKVYNHNSVIAPLWEIIHVGDMYGYWWPIFNEKTYNIGAISIPNPCRFKRHWWLEADRYCRIYNFEEALITTLAKTDGIIYSRVSEKLKEILGWIQTLK